MKRYIVCMVAVLLCMSGCARADGGTGQSGNIEKNELDGLQLTENSSVEIITEYVSGTGVVYEISDSYVAIVTAAHVLTGAKQVTITFCNQEKVVSDKIYLDENADCGFILVSMDDEVSEKLFEVCEVQKNRDVFDKIMSEQGVFVTDLEADNTLKCRYATIIDSWIFFEDFDEYMMLLSGTASAGMSGSGVYDENGVLLGILCGKNDKEELAVLPYSILDAKWIEAEQLIKVLE